MGKYALLIGVSQCQHQDVILPSPYARNDVEALGEVLMHPEIGGFSEIKPVFEPDRMAMEEAFEEFCRKCNRGDLSLVFFAGRGLRDRQGRAYFATRSTRKTADGELVQATALPAQSVHDLMGSSRSRQQVMILDCGFGEPIEQGETALQNGSFTLKHQLGARGRVILVASDDALAPSGESESELSLYTHHLIEGILTGEADQNQDGEVALDELHRYTSSKVQGIVPTMHPELIALREEDLNISLARVPLIDPHRRYREDVERYATNGQISPVARAILDQQRSHLYLSPTEALNIENQVLQPFRDDAERVQRYRSALSAAIETEYPLGAQRLSELRDLQALLELSDGVVKPIQRELMQPLSNRAAMQRQALEHYERELRSAIAQEDPLTEPTRHHLRQLQQTLALNNSDIYLLEQRLISQNLIHQEAFRKRLHQFEQAFSNAVEVKYPPSPLQQVQLKKLQHSLELTDAQVLQVERRVMVAREAQQAIHQQKLNHYQQEFAQAIAQEPTLLKYSRDRLYQLQRQLGLRDDEVMQVEEEAIAAHQTYQANLRHYEQALGDRLAIESTLSDSSLDKLTQLQETLMLNDEDVAALRQQFLELAETRRKASKTKPLDSADEITDEEAAQIFQHLGNPSPTDGTAIDSRPAEPLADNLSAQDPFEKARQSPALAEESAAAPPSPLQPDLDSLNLSTPSRDPSGLPSGLTSGLSSDPLIGIGQPPAPPPGLLNDAELLLDGSEPGDNREQPLPDLDFSDSLEQAASPAFPEAGFGSAEPLPPFDGDSSGQTPLPPTTSPEAVDHLSSERHVDYSTLQALLQDQLWLEADRETLKVMLLASGRKTQGWLSPEAIALFPCTDLHTINQLWDKYTDRQFSFTAQERIYREVSGALTDRDKAIAFGTQVKWVQKFAGIYPMFKPYEALQKTLQSPTGHLPALWYWTLSPGAALRCGAFGRTRAYGGGDIQMLSTLMNRLLDCKIL